MSIITIIGAGMMGTAIGYPAAGNGHEIRLVGTPLDDAIIDHAIATGTHLTMKRPIPAGFKFYHFTQLDEAMKGAELVISGVSSRVQAGVSRRCCFLLGHGVYAFRGAAALGVSRRAFSAMCWRWARV